MYRTVTLRKMTLCLLLFLFSLTAKTQTTATDSARVLMLQSVWQRVLEHHPIVRKIRLLEAQANAEVQMARGGFDPKLYSDWEAKSFKGSEYYTFSESGLKIPSWYGLEFKGGYETARGDRLNPENGLPTSGQAVLGVKWNALRGLIIDERRATLQKARVLQLRNVVRTGTNVE